MGKLWECPESISIPGNISIRISNNNRCILSEHKIQNRCTDEGIRYILYCILQEFTPVIKYFGISTLTRDESNQYTELKEHIFSLDAQDPNDRGMLIRDLISINDTYRARFKFYLQSNQLNGEALYRINLYSMDRNGNLFKSFSAQHATDSNNQLIIKDNTITISYEWLIGLRNESEE